MARYEEDDEQEPPRRYVSIDALRGFDMFWILGAGSLVTALNKLGAIPPIQFIANQLEHVEWEGFRFYDLIFPLFVFLMGVSTVFSLGRIVEQRGKLAAYWRLVRRFIILYLLALLYHGPMSRDGGPEMFRYLGVLHRIGLCYLFGGILFLNFRFRGLLVWSAALLVGYWLLMAFVPIGDAAPGSFEEGKNLANEIDRLYLPGYKWDGDWDPEGLLSTVPAIVSGLLGIFAGMLLKNDELEDSRRITYLVIAGVLCLALGYGWGFQFPIIKKLWTSSFVLVAAGYSYLLVALFHAIVDVAEFDIWARPFVWIGMNPITLYMIGGLVGFGDLVRRLVHQPILDRTEPWGHLVVALLGLALMISLARWMYARKIFVRI